MGVGGGGGGEGVIKNNKKVSKLVFYAQSTSAVISGLITKGACCKPRTVCQ